MSELESLLACPRCRSPVERADAVLGCSGCRAAYAVEDGIPVLLDEAETDAYKRGQARWFDEEAGGEWEIERPHGAPTLYEWLLREKFARSVAALDGLLENATALVVCGGSGMEAEFLAGAGARVVTADISLGAARRARERARRHRFDVLSIVADVERLPFADASVDVVYVHDGLHHIERPLAGVAEMARVARRAVSVSEPARAAVTQLAVRAGLALEFEEAGNRVARVTPEAVATTLSSLGFRVVRAERYGMYYRHEPGRVVGALSARPLLPVAVGALRMANRVAGRLGNKLTVQAVRADAVAG